MSSALVEDKPGDLWLLIDGWTLHLQAANRSPKTIRSYVDTVRDSLGQFLLTMGYPVNVAEIRSQHLASYQADQLRRFSAGTAALRHRTLKVFFTWLVREGEIPSSPMANLAPPTVGEIEVPVIPIEDVRKLLATCANANFDDRRDAAIIRLFYDTGLRLAEMAGLQVDDVDISGKVLHVTGKGNKGRAACYATKTATAVNRYLRERSKHSAKDSPAWWIGSPRCNDAVRYRTDVEKALCPCWNRSHPSSSVSAFLCGGLVGGRWIGGRPDATCRLVESGHVVTVRPLHGSRTCYGGA